MRFLCSPTHTNIELMVCQTKETLYFEVCPTAHITTLLNCFQTDKSIKPLPIPGAYLGGALGARAPRGHQRGAEKKEKRKRKERERREKRKKEEKKGVRKKKGKKEGARKKKERKKKLVKSI